MGGGCLLDDSACVWMGWYGVGDLGRKRDYLLGFRRFRYLSRVWSMYGCVVRENKK